MGRLWDFTPKDGQDTTKMLWKGGAITSQGHISTSPPYKYEYQTPLKSPEEPNISDPRMETAIKQWPTPLGKSRWQSTLRDSAICKYSIALYAHWHQHKHTTQQRPLKCLGIRIRLQLKKRIVPHKGWVPKLRSRRPAERCNQERLTTKKLQLDRKPEAKLWDTPNLWLLVWRGPFKKQKPRE